MSKRVCRQGRNPGGSRWLAVRLLGIACTICLCLLPDWAQAERIGTIRLPDSIPDLIKEEDVKDLLAPTPINDSWASTGHRPLGIHLDNYSLSQLQIDAARQTGCRLVRLTIPMEHFVADANPDWAVLDQVVSRLVRSDLEVLPVLTSGAVVPEYYLAFCQAIAQRYAPTFDYYQLLDNVNYSVGVTTRDYADLLRQSRVLIREADPDAQIVMGGVRGVDLEFLRLLEERGAIHYVDVLAFNLFPPANGLERIDPYGRPEHCLPAVEQAAEFAQRYNKPFWITTLGVSTSYSRIGVDQADQAAMYARGALLLGYYGAERIIFAAIQDTDPAYQQPARCCGILDVTGQPKASYYALQSLNLAIEGSYHVDSPGFCQGLMYEQPQAHDMFLAAEMIGVEGADELSEFRVYNRGVYAFWFYIPELQEYRLIYWAERDGPRPLLLSLSLWQAKLRPLSRFTLLDMFSSDMQYYQAENMVHMPYQPLAALPGVIRFEVLEHGRSG